VELAVPNLISAATTTCIRLSPCAAAHYHVVKNLTAEQLAAPYPLACVERWGPVLDGKRHAVVEEGRHGQASLGLLLTKTWACDDCNRDGDQFFRSAHQHRTYESVTTHTTTDHHH
jgi:hypothetical protein